MRILPNLGYLIWIFHSAVIFCDFFFFNSEHRISNFTLIFTGYCEKIVLTYRVQSWGVKNIYRSKCHGVSSTWRTFLHKKERAYLQLTCTYTMYEVFCLTIIWSNFILKKKQIMWFAGSCKTKWSTLKIHFWTNSFFQIHILNMNIIAQISNQTMFSLELSIFVFRVLGISMSYAVLIAHRVGCAW